MKRCPESAPTEDPIVRANQILRTIADLRSQDFSGVGIVFYEFLDELPHVQLVDGSEEVAHWRSAGTGLSAALSNISISTSSLHDGFHFVHVSSWQLTHVSQFISPPIPRNASQRFHGTGARLMAAVLASLLPGVACVGIVSHRGGIHLFRDGCEAAQKG